MKRSVVGSGLFAGVAILLCALLPLAAVAAEEKIARPDRGMAVYTEYSGIHVGPGEPVRMELTVENKGKADENIALKLTTVPKGWKASIKGTNYAVNAVPVPATKTRTLTFTADPDKTVRPGSFLFQIDAATADGKFTSSQQIHVTVKEKAAAADDIHVTTSYPVLRGETESKFEFSLEVNNKSETDKTINLAGQIPEKWELNFKPAYEQKQISSFRLKGGQSQSISVEVTPEKNATAGTYPVMVVVSAGERKIEVKLTVVLTGIYRLDAGTPTGLLSVDASTGKPSIVSLFVKNTGSAANKNITFNSFKPENWKVEFKPEQIESLEPGALKQVEVTITPAAQALVGDYSVGLMVNGEKASNKTVELRVGVKTSSAWGWIGIALILAVIAGLGGLFVWLGRR